MSEQVIAEVILRQADKPSLVESKEAITAENIDKYRVGKEVIEDVSRKLEEMGFKIVQRGPTNLTISADSVRFENIFQTKLRPRSKAVMGGTKAQAVYYEATEPIKVPVELSSQVSNVVLPAPPEFHPSF